LLLETQTNITLPSPKLNDCGS